MKSIRKNYIALVSIVPLLMATSCGGGGEDVSGKLKGVWQATWNQDLDGDLDDIHVTERLAFIDGNDSGSHGDFLQIFNGTVKFDDDQNEGTVPYLVSVKGDWGVKNGDEVEMRYDVTSMKVQVGSGSLEAPYNAIGEGMTLTVTPNGKQLKESVQEMVNRQVSAFFRDMFHKINEDKVGLKSVKVDGRMMTCKVNVGFSGRKMTYDKADIDVSSLSTAATAQTTAQSTESASAQAPEMPEPPAKRRRATTSGMPNYDWLSHNYVSGADLAGRSAAELRIMRNYMYARHGYRFKSPDLQRYFANYSWYTPRYSNVEHLLNKIEKSNIHTIKMYE